MSRKYKDLTGQRFGYLVAIKPNGKTKNCNIIWDCLCDCGNHTNVTSGNLVRGSITSCGCKRSYTISEKNKTHGKSGTRLYMVWSRMVTRCTKPSHHAYKDYGGRGITVCEEWKNNYQSFYDWAMKTGYNDNAPMFECTLDRIDVDGNYEPSNCRWVTIKEQARNRRSSRIIEYKGKKYCAVELAEKINMSVDTLKRRLNKGWSVDDAVNTPVRKWNRKGETK